jgi:hypothetical protein
LYSVGLCPFLLLQKHLVKAKIRENSNSRLQYLQNGNKTQECLSSKQLTMMRGTGGAKAKSS